MFAPSLTLLSSPDLVKKICHIGVGADIVYENGAVVKTSFVKSTKYPKYLLLNLLF